MTEAAFDDQCTGANPRYPLISELKQLYLDAYYGNVFVETEMPGDVQSKAAPAKKTAAKSTVTAEPGQKKRSRKTKAESAPTEPEKRGRKPSAKK